MILKLDKIDKFFYKNMYLIFLVSLVSWIGLLPLLNFTGIEPVLEFVAVNFVLISSIYFFYYSKQRILAFGFVPMVLLVYWLSFFTRAWYLLEIERTLILVLMMFIAVHKFKKIFFSKEVSVEVIFASISGYILIGIIASILCWFAYSIYPGAYNIDFANNERLTHFMYYSFVTMSTLGYGDITPQLPESKALAVFITLVGQFYMTVLMALLIGKFLTQNKD